MYIIRSDRHPSRFYTGITSNVPARVEAHNAGLSTHTATGRPWSLVVQFWFADAARAEAFELYLKSGSGRAFALRHLR